MIFKFLRHLELLCINQQFNHSVPDNFLVIMSHESGAETGMRDVAVAVQFVY